MSNLTNYTDLSGRVAVVIGRRKNLINDGSAGLDQ
jgi:hypothetical protein